MSKLNMRVLSIIVLLGMLLSPFQPQVVLAQPPEQQSPQAHVINGDAKDKIESQVLKELSVEGTTDFFVWMAEKADLTPAARLKTKEAKGQFVYTTLQETADRTQKALREWLDGQGVGYQAFYISNKILVRGGSQELVFTLAERSDVARITADHKYQLDEPRIIEPKDISPEAIEPNISFINADDVWAMGVTGEGIVLAGNDTGLFWDHPAIINHYRGWDGVNADHNYNWWDATGTYPNQPGDGFGHGTHTTGTMVGDDGGDNQIGVAPGAQTVHCKNMDDWGGGQDSSFIECFQWDLAPWDLNGQNPRPDLAPDAINNSWGYWGGNYPEFEDEIAALQAAGILVEVSAGNEGPACGSLRSPGDYGLVLTTGSVNHASGILPGALTDFSSRGPSLLSPDYLPDIMAPGENIRSAVPGDGYEYWGGTSMAGPHATALIGLMWAANPGLRGMVEETMEIIYHTAIPLTGQQGSSCGGDYEIGPNNDWGFGAIDAFAAVQAAMTFGGTGTLEGTVTDNSSSSPLEDVQISARLSPTLTWYTLTDELGYFNRRVFSGTFTVTAELYGYYPVVVTGVQVISGTTTTLDMAMDPTPFYLVSGKITDIDAGWPLYARIDVEGYPGGAVWSDPVTGDYSISLAAGTQYTFNITAQVDGYKQTSRVVGPLAGPQVEDFGLEVDLNLCTSPGYIPEFAYFEDFENDDGAFTVDGTTSWEWGKPTSGPGEAHSGYYGWATNLEGDYQDGEYGSITSPEIDLSAIPIVQGGGGTGPILIVSWWQYLVTEECCDFASVEISNDGGNTWQLVLSGSGNVDTSWTKHDLFLDTSFAVPNFRMRFTLSTDWSITAPGFYVDDIGIGWAAEPPALYEQDFEADDGNYTVSGVTSWEWGEPTRGPSGAHSGLNVWATNLDGNYEDNEHGFITSPAIDLSSALPLITGGGGGGGEVMLRLSWWQWLQTESGYDFASIEISDGISWTEIYTASGIIDLDWGNYTFLMNPAIYAVDNFRVRFQLQSDDSLTYPGFYVDDVKVDIYTGQIPAVPCTLQAGGLVVGNVYDKNTSLGLVDAKVSGVSDYDYTRATPGDEGLDDGFYTLFSPAGLQELTAELDGYSTDIQSPTVLLSDTIWQDFTLDTGLLDATPAGLAATLELGISDTLTFTLSNLGGLDVNFGIQERGGDYIPAVLSGVYVPGNLETLGSSIPAYSVEGLFAHDISWYMPPTGAHLSSSGATVLLVFAFEASQIQAMLQAYPDLTVVDYFDARNATPTLDQLQGYDVVILGSNNYFADPVALGDVLADYVDAGGYIIQTVPTFDGNSPWGVQGRFAEQDYSPYSWTGDWWSWSDLGEYDPTHPIMEDVSAAGDELRQIVDMNGEVEWVASWTDDEFVVAKGSVVAVNAFLSDGYYWTGDIPLILHNSIFYLLTGNDVPWLSTEPVTGTVVAEGSQMINVTLDASVVEVAQPGDYLAELKVSNNSPYDALVLPVTMTINAPTNWGKLTGTVTGLAACDLPGEPLANATVSIAEVGDISTAEDGTFSYWMAAGNYTLSIYAQGYITQVLTTQITPGNVDNQLIDLRLDSPCQSVSADTLEVTLVEGYTITQEILLGNSGAGSLTYQLLESLLDLSYINVQPLHTSNILVGQTGPASVRSLGITSGVEEQVETPLSGWFSGMDLPGGLIRYAYAQCQEQPESYYVFSGVDSSFGISNKSWRYDTVSNSWTQLADIPSGGEAPAAACYQGKIYVMGGNGKDQLFIYDVAKDSWYQGANLPRGVEGSGAAAWNAKVYLIGGDDNFYPGDGVSDQVNVYDIATDTWLENATPLPIATGNAGAAQAGQYLYIVGGWGEIAPSSNVTATQRYDMATDTWELGPVYESAHADFALAVTDQGLYAMAGDKDGGFYFDGTDTVERLPLAGWPTGTWTEMDDPLPLVMSANNAGFCTQGLMDAASAEIWSLGGADFEIYVIHGRTLFNDRPGEKCLSIYTDVEWLAENPVVGSVAPDTEGILMITIDATALTPGIYNATLVIYSNDTTLPLKYIPVTLTVIEKYILSLPWVSK